jgi:hypothetical protein
VTPEDDDDFFIVPLLYDEEEESAQMEARLREEAEQARKDEELATPESRGAP